MRLPARSAGAGLPVQQKPDPVDHAARTKRRALTGLWLDSAMLPDIYAPPVQRKRAHQDAQEAPPPASGGGRAMPAK